MSDCVGELLWHAKRKTVQPFELSDEDGAPYDLTGKTARMLIYTEAMVLLANLTGTLSATPTDGVITVTALPADIDGSWESAIYCLDVLTSGVPETWVESSITASNKPTVA